MDLHAVAGEFGAPGLRKYLFLLLILLVPPSLYLFQSVVFGGLLSADFVIVNFILDYSKPNLQSMFFANYLHNPFDPGHLSFNMISFVVIGLFIWFFYYHVIPASGVLLPKNFLGINLAVLFLAFPFAISGTALFFWRLGCLPDDIWFGVGFSGIVWAFTGFLLFLMCFVLFIEIFVYGPPSGGGGLKDIRKNTYYALFFISSAVMALLFLIFMDVGTEKNPFAHFAGLALGFIIPAPVAIYLDEEIRWRRASCFLMIFIILAAASCIWLFV